MDTGMSKTSRCGRSPAPLNGADLVWTLVEKATSVATAEMARFRQFSKQKPLSFPELFYVLENSIVVSRMMDTASSNYM